MPTFSERGRERLYTCHSQLIELFTAVVGGFDCTVLCGHREEPEQDRLFLLGRTRLLWPDSNHNKEPSLAIDVAPYPINWDDIHRFYFFAGYVKGIASRLGYKIRWGGDWDSDTQVKDNKFNDLVHFELKNG